jgi:hypothetical protein
VESGVLVILQAVWHLESIMKFVLNFAGGIAKIPLGHRGHCRQAKGFFKFK